MCELVKKMKIGTLLIITSALIAICASKKCNYFESWNCTSYKHLIFYRRNFNFDMLKKLRNFSVDSISLELNNIFEIPDRAFADIKLKHLNLVNNNIREINSRTFEGVEPLSIILSNNSITTLGNWSIPASINVYLDGNKITVIDASIFRNITTLKYLQLEGNKISIIPDNTFDDATLSNLFLTNNKLAQLTLIKQVYTMQEIHYSNNKIKSIKPRSIPRARIVYLSDNLISTLTENMFQDITVVSVLHLDHNNIYSVGASVFLGASFHFLDLSDNKISGGLIKPLFKGVERINELKLKYNELAKLEDNSFPPLKRIYLNNNFLTTIAGSSFSNLSQLELVVADHNCLMSIQFPTLTNIEIRGTNSNCSSREPIGNNMPMINLMFYVAVGAIASLILIASAYATIKVFRRRAANKNALNDGIMNRNNALGDYLSPVNAVNQYDEINLEREFNEYQNYISGETGRNYKTVNL